MNTITEYGFGSFSFGVKAPGIGSHVIKTGSWAVPMGCFPDDNNGVPVRYAKGIKTTSKGATFFKDDGAAFYGGVAASQKTDKPMKVYSFIIDKNERDENGDNIADENGNIIETDILEDQAADWSLLQPDVYKALKNKTLVETYNDHLVVRFALTDEAAVKIGADLDRFSKKDGVLICYDNGVSFENMGKINFYDNEKKNENGKTNLRVTIGKLEQAGLDENDYKILVNSCNVLSDFGGVVDVDAYDRCDPKSRLMSSGHPFVSFESIGLTFSGYQKLLAYDSNADELPVAESLPGDLNPVGSMIGESVEEPDTALDNSTAAITALAGSLADVEGVSNELAGIKDQLDLIVGYQKELADNTERVTGENATLKVTVQNLTEDNDTIGAAFAMSNNENQRLTDENAKARLLYGNLPEHPELDKGTVPYLLARARIAAGGLKKEVDYQFEKNGYIGDIEKRDLKLVHKAELIAQYLEQVDKQGEHIGELTAERDGYQLESEEKGKEIVVLRGDVADRDGQIEKLQEKVGPAELFISTMGETTYGGFLEVFPTLVKRIKTLTRASRESRGVVDSDDPSYGLKLSSDQITDMAEVFKKEREKFDETMKRVDSFKEQISELTDQLATYGDINPDELKRLQDELERNMIKFDAHEKEFGNLERAFSTAESAFNKEKAGLIKENSDYKIKVEDLEKQLEEAQQLDNVPAVAPVVDDSVIEIEDDDDFLGDELSGVTEKRKGDGNGN